MPLIAAKTFSLENMKLWSQGGKPAEGMNTLFRSYEKVWFVSIVDNGYPRAMAPSQDTICFSFDDIDIDDPDEWRVNGVLMKFSSGALFSPEEARRLVRFLDMAHADPRKALLAVHCHAGVSRSGGIVTFAQKAYKLPLPEFESMNPWIVPNNFVIRLLTEAKEKNCP